MYKRKFSAQIVVASRGDGVPQEIDTPYGPMRSRNAAELKFTSNDANELFSRWNDPDSPPGFRVLLIDPTVGQLEEEVRRVSRTLREFPQGQTGIDFAFFGHGRPNTGALVLRGGDFSASRLLGLQTDDVDVRAGGSRGLALFLDSCFAGSFLAHLVHQAYIEHRELFLVFDALLSSQPDETSWELSFLEHGAFTYTFLYRGSRHVNFREFQEAIDRQDQRVIARCLQGLVSGMADATSYLTQGKQHSIEIVSAHSEINLEPDDTPETLTSKILALRNPR